MKSIQTWLSEYGESHQNPTNKQVHFICVPFIFLTIVGLFYSIKLPLELPAIGQLTVAHILLLLVAIYYFTLSKSAQLYLPCTTGPFISNKVGLALAAVLMAVASQVNTSKPY